MSENENENENNEIPNNDSENTLKQNITVDDDWKSKIEAEKTGHDNATLPPPPPASFEVLVSMLFTQAMATLGQIPDPISGKPKVNKPYAKHYIDTLEMIGDKTKGNLSSDESKILSEALHALRMVYVDTKAN